MKHYQKPAWGRLYLAGTGAIALLVAEHWLPVSTLDHHILQVLAIVAVYMWMARWIRRNADAIEEEAGRQQVREQWARYRDTPVTAVQERYLEVLGEGPKQRDPATLRVGRPPAVDEHP